MGMVDAFDDRLADFSGLTGNKGLFISGVFHKAFIDVTESGTEAAAATAVVVGLKSMPSPSTVFRADHPFVFLIRHKPTGSTLFLGRVSNPAE
jgi:serpin B